MTVFGIDDLPLPWRYSKTDGCLIAADEQPIDWSLDAAVFDEVKNFEAKAVNCHALLRDALSDLVEVCQSAIASGLFVSVDGKKPDIQALHQAHEALKTAGKRLP